MKTSWQKLIQKGVTSRGLGNLRAAEKHFKQGYGAVPKTDIESLIKVETLLGYFFYQRKQFEKSERYLLQVARRLDNFSKATAQNFERIFAILGLVKKAKGEIEEAEKYYLQALNKAEEAGSLECQPEYCALLGHFSILKEDYSNGIKMVEKSLSLMEQNPVRYRVEIQNAKELLVVIYGKVGRLEERKKLREELISQRIEKEVTQKRRHQLPDSSKPSSWGTDELTFFLHEAEANTTSSVGNLEAAFINLRWVDSHFRIMTESARNFTVGKLLRREIEVGKNLQVENEDRLEIYFLQQSHSFYLASVRLILSGQVAPAYALLRGCIENSLYCVRVHSNPKLKAVWLNRMNNKKAVKENFQISQMWTDLAKLNSNLQESVQSQYELTIDEGAHPNVSAFLKDSYCELAKDGKSTQLGLVYLNPDRIQDAMNSIEKIAKIALEIFDLVFDSLEIKKEAESDLS